MAAEWEQLVIPGMEDLVPEEPVIKCPCWPGCLELPAEAK